MMIYQREFQSISENTIFRGDLYMSQYKHWIKSAEKDPSFPDKYNFVLIKTIKDLESLKKENIDADYCAWDIESTGLNPAEDNIVGVSIAFDSKTGYYIPINHLADPSLGDEALSIFYDIIMSMNKCFLFNCRFDMRFMEYAGYDMSEINYYDVQNACWLSDTNNKLPSLKEEALRFLGWEMQSYQETLGDEVSLYTVHPKDLTYYAATDAIATFALAGVTLDYYKESKPISEIDNKIFYPVMKVEEQSLNLNEQYLQEILDEARDELMELEKDIYKDFGHSFNIGSGQQLADAISKLGLDTGEYTKSGYMKTGKNLLDKLYQISGDEVLLKIIKYKELSKKINSYIEPLRRFARERPDAIRVCYHLNKVPTGRFASGRDKNNDFFITYNIQSSPKSEEEIWYTEHRPGNKDKSEFNIMGWEFSKEPISDRWLESSDSRRNVRRGFIPDEDYYWVSIDFKSEELFIPTMISGEPVWMEAFEENKDIHKQTAIRIFGEENYDKNKRQMAKACNFGILYGMNHYSLAERFNMEIKEAEQFINNYKRNLSTLFAWANRHKKKAKKTGTAYTYFGRPRRLAYYLNHDSYSMRSFGQRSAVNTTIQGSGADILKIVLWKLWNKVITHPDYSDAVDILAFIHDEICFQVRKDKMAEIIPKIVDIMEMQAPGWKLPLEVDFEIGHSWGLSFPFTFSSETGEFKPDYKIGDLD